MRDDHTAIKAAEDRLDASVDAAVRQLHSGLPDGSISRNNMLAAAWYHGMLPWRLRRHAHMCNVGIDPRAIVVVRGRSLQTRQYKIPPISAPALTNCLPLIIQED